LAHGGPVRASTKRVRYPLPNLLLVLVNHNGKYTQFCHHSDWNRLFIDYMRGFHAKGRYRCYIIIDLIPNIIQYS
jgi:hypothetical protein